MVRSRHGSVWARPLLFLGTLVLTLVPLELVAYSRFEASHARLTEQVIESRPASDDPERTLYLIDLVQPSRWPDVVYELRPSVQGRFIDCSYRSSALGLRDSETQIAKPPDTFRIALLGDSFSFGWGVEVEQSIAHLLESQLADAAGGRSVEVLNFSVPGYNTAIEAACLEHKALAFEPDLVLVQYFQNDEYLPVFVLEESPRPVSYLIDWIAGRLGQRTTPGASLAHPSRGDAPEGGSARDATALAEWRRDPARVPEHLAYMVGKSGVERALQRIHDLVAPSGTPVALLVVALPPPRMVNDAGPSAALPDPAPEVTAAAERLGFSVIQTLEPAVSSLRAAGRSPLELILSGDDWHPNAEAHALFARITAEGLTKSGLLRPPGR